MKGITKAAKLANGRSQSCVKCPLKTAKEYAYPNTIGSAPMLLLKGSRKA